MWVASTRALVKTVLDEKNPPSVPAYTRPFAPTVIACQSACT
jgi:hypothetical protein